MRVIVKPFDWIIALFAGPALVLMAVAWVNPRGYSAGLANATHPFYFVEGVLFAAGAVLELIALIWLLVTWGKSSKATRIFGLAVSALPVLLALMLLVLPLHMYRRGLARWAASRVNPAAVRTWYAGGPKDGDATAEPPFPGAREIALSDCPPEISMMTPSHVWTRPGVGGVFLEWGDSGWGFSHHLFMGQDASTPPPPEIGGWARAAPGMYVTDR